MDAAQLRLYAIMVEKGLGRPVSRASFWFLEGGEAWTEAVDPKALAEVEAQAVALAREMQSADSFPGRVGHHCAHCPYLHACQHRDEIAQRRQAEGW